MSKPPQLIRTDVFQPGSTTYDCHVCLANIGYQRQRQSLHNDTCVPLCSISSLHRFDIRFLTASRCCEHFIKHPAVRNRPESIQEFPELRVRNDDTKYQWAAKIYKMKLHFLFHASSHHEDESPHSLPNIHHFIHCLQLNLHNHHDSQNSFHYPH